MHTNLVLVNRVKDLLFHTTQMLQWENFTPLKSIITKRFNLTAQHTRKCTPYATCSYPEPSHSSPCLLYSISWTSILILHSHLRLHLPNTLLPHASAPNPCVHLSPPHPCHMPHSSNFSWFYHSIILSEYTSLSSSLCSLLNSPVTLFFLAPYTHSPSAYFNVTDRALRPYITTGNVA